MEEGELEVQAEEAHQGREGGPRQGQDCSDQVRTVSGLRLKIHREKSWEAGGCQRRAQNSIRNVIMLGGVRSGDRCRYAAGHEGNALVMALHMNFNVIPNCQCCIHQYLEPISDQQLAHALSDYVVLSPVSSRPMSSGIWCAPIVVRRFTCHWT